MELECRALRKMYGGFTAIEEINYKFSAGVYGLLGPNGAGKSTWMKLLTASLRPTEGNILWNGTPIEKIRQEYVGRIGYVPQNQNLFPYFTGCKFLYYMAALKGIKKELADKQIPLLLQRVNLKEAGRRKISTYSGGMKQRLLIAQAFLGNPEVVYMDEPTAGLDPKERIRIRNLISEMSMNKIVLIATHVVSDVEFISKEILLMKKGRIIGSGASEALEDELDGMVFEKELQQEELDAFMKEHLVGGIRKEGNRILVRYLSRMEDDGTADLVRPTLDDVYLHHFREEERYGTE